MPDAGSVAAGARAAVRARARAGTGAGAGAGAQAATWRYVGEGKQHIVWRFEEANENTTSDAVDALELDDAHATGVYAIDEGDTADDDAHRFGITHAPLSTRELVGHVVKLDKAVWVTLCCASRASPDHHHAQRHHHAQHHLQHHLRHVSRFLSPPIQARHPHAILHARPILIDSTLVARWFALAQHARPAHRLHQQQHMLDEVMAMHGHELLLAHSAPFVPAVLLPDVSLMRIARTRSFTHTRPLALCVELKPKWAIVPRDSPLLCEHTRAIKTRNCRFCMHQHLKALESSGSDSPLSSFCPLDLFSGSPTRTERAIDALLRDPQNNLRLHVHHPSLGAAIAVDPTTLWRRDGGRDQVADTSSPHAPIVLDLLRSLVGDIDVADGGTEATDGTFCGEATGAALHALRPRIVSLLARVICSPPVAPLLRRIRAIQLVGDAHDVEAIAALYSHVTSLQSLQQPGASDADDEHWLWQSESDRGRLSRWLEQFVQDVDRVDDALMSEPSASAATTPPSCDAKKWSNVSDSQSPLTASSSCSCAAHERQRAWVASMPADEQLHWLRRFLIAHTFKDVSVMVAMEPRRRVDERGGEQDEQAAQQVVVDDDNDRDHVHVRVHLIDVEPKRASKIPEYAQLDRRIIRVFARASEGE